MNLQVSQIRHAKRGILNLHAVPRHTCRVHMPCLWWDMRWQSALRGHNQVCSLLSRLVGLPEQCSMGRASRVGIDEDSLNVSHIEMEPLELVVRPKSLCCSLLITALSDTAQILLTVLITLTEVRHRACREATRASFDDSGFHGVATSGCSHPMSWGWRHCSAPRLQLKTRVTRAQLGNRELPAISKLVHALSHIS